MEQKRETVLEWYRKNHNEIDAPCGGLGECGRCKIKFLANAPEASEKEKKSLTEEELMQGIRLACMTEKTDRITESDFAFVGGLFSHGVEVPIEDEMKFVSKQYSGQKTEVEQVQEFGIALDIGTTTLAMRLVDLQSGQSVMTITAMNHQRAYGADVITRIKAANEGNLAELQKCIQQDIYGMLEALLAETDISFSQVKKIVIAGNTTMCHLLLGYSCEGLGEVPFLPVNIDLVQMTVQELFKAVEECNVQDVICDNTDVEVVILPGISAFVGADIVAGMYYCDMDIKEEPQMLLDVGTNGEMVIGGKYGFIVTSAAAGPVFEGGNISCGMPAVKGAIAHIKEDSCEVVGDAEPKGICGSGLVDLAAYLLDAQVIDENGTLCDAYFDEGYPVCNCLKNNPAGSMKMTQADIREIQMGKAAIRAGIEVLTEDDKPECIYLAGGFGAAMDVVSAVKIDLLPEQWCNRIESVGNAALEGAHKFLLDEHGTGRVKGIVEKSREILLAEQGNFEEKYIHFMQFLI